MRRTTFVLALVTVVVTGSVSPAAAGPVGLTCGHFLTGEGKEPGATTEEFTGEIEGGPISVNDPEAVTTTLSCWLQVNSDVPDTNVMPESVVSCTHAGDTVPACARVIEIELNHGDVVRNCTRITWSNRFGETQTYTYDRNPEQEGIQC